MDIHKYEFQLILSREVSLIENSSNHISQLTAHVDFTNFLLFRCRLLFWRRRPPTWQKADLRMTRVKDTDNNELLFEDEQFIFVGILHSSHAQIRLLPGGGF